MAISTLSATTVSQPARRTNVNQIFDGITVFNKALAISQEVIEDGIASYTLKGGSMVGMLETSDDNEILLDNSKFIDFQLIKIISAGGADFVTTISTTNDGSTINGGKTFLFSGAYKYIELYFAGGNYIVTSLSFQRPSL